MPLRPPAPLPDAPLVDPALNMVSPERVSLGRMLFFDPRLSKNHDVSCNTCHLVGSYGVDHLKVSSGHKHQMGPRNAPSIYNAAGHFVQFWDGRSPNVEHQATQPLVNPTEMAANDKLLVRVVESIPAYAEFFKKVFPKEQKPVTVQNIGKAIGAYERMMLTPAPWDKFLKGDDSALTNAQKRGLNTFIGAGCLACHNGAYLGGSMYQKVGVKKPWPNQKDQGRFMITKLDADKMMFKVPSLRNVLKTGPYFHDGETADIKVAIKMMGEYQLGKSLSETEVQDIATFFESLTGELPANELIAMPALPLSSDKTPKPDPK
ncbi:MAG: c-type cytochrome [Deltaproteobacteria bacterium]|nr:MAG: c-type cytochrome [Deltaproteobacteria bacterium]